MSATYLSRPVFDFDVNWADVPKKRYDYDLREVLLGFAAPAFERLQSHTVRAIEFEMLFESEAAVAAWDAFTAEVKGRLGGFWFPSPFSAMELESDVSSTVLFMIQDQGFMDWCQDHPGQHLAFFKPGHTTQYGRVTLEDPVAKTNDGRELVYLEGALSEPVDDTWQCCTLLYVRLASDEEEGEFYGEGRQIRKVKVLELPKEYEEIETGQAPVILYDFFTVHGGYTQHWRLTGLNTHVTSDGEIFTSTPIKHRERTVSMRQQRDEITIESWHDPALNPMSHFIPFKVPSPLWVLVYRSTFANLDERELLFTGKIIEVGNVGKKLTAKCSGLWDVVGRRYLKFYIQPRCNYFVFDQNCRAIKIQFGGNIRYLSGRVVKLTALVNPPMIGRPESADFNFFALGWLEVGADATFEVRSIRQSSAPVKFQTGPDMWEITFRLDRPLEHATVGNLVQVFPGCDGAWKTCTEKFFNGANYGGQDNIPNVNPAVRAMEAENASGNKK